MATEFDPAWFFAALAQSAAAIVALIGALQLARIQDDKDTVLRRRPSVVAAITELSNQLQANKSILLRLVSFWSEERDRDTRAIDEGKTERVYTEIRDWGNSSSGGTTVYEIQPRLTLTLDRLREAQLLRDLVNFSPCGEVDASQLESRIRTLTDFLGQA